MEKKEVTAVGPVAIAGISLILVTRSSIRCQPVGGSISFSGIKQPISIVVASPSTNKAFDVTGEEISLDQLIQEVPSLAEVLEID